MRAQPFHKGHAAMIREISSCCTKLIIMLDMRSGDTDNPFPYNLRKQWIEHYIQSDPALAHVHIADRQNGHPFKTRKEEYRHYFNGGDCVVITTDETDELFRERGFQTINHTDSDFREYLEQWFIPRKYLHSTGRVIRKRLREGLPCDDLLFSYVEEEARLWLKN